MQAPKTIVCRFLKPPGKEKQNKNKLYLRTFGKGVIHALGNNYLYKSKCFVSATTLPQGEFSLVAISPKQTLVLLNTSSLKTKRMLETHEGSAGLMLPGQILTLQCIMEQDKPCSQMCTVIKYTIEKAKKTI